MASPRNSRPSLLLKAFVLIVSGNFLFFSYAMADSESTIQQHCWSTVISANGARNLQIVCFEGEAVKVLTFYANPSAIPTVCRQLGQVERVAEANFVIQTQIGRCENGKGMVGSLYECRRTGENEIHCLVDNEIELIFKQERRDLYVYGEPEDRVYVGHCEPPRIPETSPWEINAAPEVCSLACGTVAKVFACKVYDPPMEGATSGEEEAQRRQRGSDRNLLNACHRPALVGIDCPDDRRCGASQSAFALRWNSAVVTASRPLSPASA